jgi:hypothetical protein
MGVCNLDFTDCGSDPVTVFYKQGYEYSCFRSKRGIYSPRDWLLASQEGA